MRFSLTTKKKVSCLTKPRSAMFRNGHARNAQGVIPCLPPNAGRYYEKRDEPQVWLLEFIACGGEATLRQKMRRALYGWSRYTSSG